MTGNLYLQSEAENYNPDTHSDILIVGIGGAGGNAVNKMICSELGGVADFLVADTNAQALANAMTEHKIQLGSTLTRGLGCGASPEVGRAAAEEAINDIIAQIQPYSLVVCVAGLGGGTGTGATQVFAAKAKELGKKVFCIVTLPFTFEGAHRKRLAQQGLNELRDKEITISEYENQDLFKRADEKSTFADAYRISEELIQKAVEEILKTECGIDINAEMAKKLTNDEEKSEIGNAEILKKIEERKRKDKEAREKKEAEDYAAKCHADAIRELVNLGHLHADVSQAVKTATEELKEKPYDIEGLVRVSSEKLAIIETDRKKEKEENDKKYQAVLEIITKHSKELSIRKNQLSIPGAYGVVDEKPWYDEKHLFIMKVIQPAINGMAIIEHPKISDKFWVLGVGDELDYDKICAAIDTAVNTASATTQFNKNISPAEYEALIANSLKENGWDARITKATGDQGIDVIAIKNALKVVIQCKLYSTPVGNAAVQEAISGREFEKADYAVVVSNSAYTKSARQLASVANVLLLHHEEVQDLETKILHIA